ncbi:XRE family transcriptional regulator [Actinomadura logoneensis]|uniref:XRE family transcriptional regulator n=1 Tax=Actinomadura logoneensis TaxID=2293572 RepID=A0A372JU37_9ACTN|nr:helix-turn-helix transcriptional regulator [Actinomadura logoneensis]RFU42868.1 XRE family transcriptional regulator [Actinomadura logoneensis]
MDGLNPEGSPQVKGSLWELIATQLRRHRKERGLSGDALGRLLDVNRSTVSRYESGKLKLQEHHAIKIDIAWRTNWLFTNLVRFAKEGHDREWFATHLELESRASELCIWEYAWIPGLFQTEAYARALVRAAGLENIDAEVAARMKRQERLARPGAPTMWVILDENVITAEIGSREITRAQLARLLELAECPNISIRIVPKSAGEHVGRDGSFKLMTVDGADCAYIEAAGEGRLVQDATDVRSYRTRFARIGDVALPVRASIELIRQVMEGLA